MRATCRPIYSLNQFTFGQMKYPTPAKISSHYILRALAQIAPQRFFDLLEGFSAQAQGKGWGNDSVKYEVEACLMLLGGIPEVFIDIGANHGDYASEVLKFHPFVECHLFEPSSACVYSLTSRFSSFKHIHINQCALGDRSTRSSLYAPDHGSAYASLSERRLTHHNIKMNPLEEVCITRFDEYWRDDRPIDYVKIDVEGFEMAVLSGFGSFISRAKLIQFEFGSAHIDSRLYFQDFWYFFAQHGFDIYRITPGGPRKVKAYKDRDECFSTTNYIALNQARFE